MSGWTRRGFLQRSLAHGGSALAVWVGGAPRAHAGRCLAPPPLSLRHARGFSLSAHPGYKILTIAPLSPRPQRYLLRLCPEAGPSTLTEFDGVFDLPLQRVFSASTPHTAALSAVGALDSLTGVASRAFISTPAVLAQLEAAPLVEFNASGVVDLEKIVHAAPEVVIGGEIAPREADRLRALGIAVLPYDDWQEETPLGRAEWIKLVGALANKDAQAEGHFAQVEARYQALAARFGGLAPTARPQVLSGAAFEGTFFAPGGRSFTAAAIHDAGGRYLFGADQTATTLAIRDFERSYLAGLEADIWINAALSYKTRADIAAEDPRLLDWPPVQAGQVWMADGRKGPKGGVAIFEEGALYPDRVLEDLQAILHPKLGRTEGLRYYRQIGGA